jgi:transcriptional regulator of acetoin/glycerol metabolism
MEMQAIREAIKECGGNVSAAARRLGVSRHTLYRKLGTNRG